MSRLPLDPARFLAADDADVLTRNESESPIWQAASAALDSALLKLISRDEIMRRERWMETGYWRE